MLKYSFFRKYYLQIIGGTTALLFLYLLSLESLVLFHSIAEFFSIVVAFSIFMVIWNSRWFLQNNYFLFIGIAFLFVSALDFLHTLAFEGMGLFKGINNNLSMELWIASRYIQSTSFIIAPLLFKKKLNTRFVFIGYLTVFLFATAAIFYWDIFPNVLVNYNEMTLFKKSSEIIISLFFLLALALLYKHKTEFDKIIFKFVSISLLIATVSELLFVFYGAPESIFNMAGLILKIVSFYFIYKAVIEIGLQKPYRLFLRDVKQHEEALVRTNEFNKTLLNTIPFFIDIVDENGNILFANKKFSAFYNEPILGKKCWKLYKDNGKKCENCPLKKDMNIGQTLTLEVRNIFGGKIFKITHTGMRFQGKKAVMEIFRDITKQKTIEEVTNEERLYAENIVNTVRMPLIVLNFDFKVVSANWFFYKTYGFLEEETVGKVFFEIYNNYWNIPLLREKLNDLVKKNISVHDLEINHNFPSIGRRVMLFTARRVYQAGSQSHKILISIADITERRKAEEHIRISEEKYRNIFDGANDAIITVDREDNVTSWNSSAERVFGWSKEEARGKKLASLIVPPELIKERNEKVKMGLMGSSIAGIETVRLHKNGQKIYVSLGFSPIINAKNQIIGLCGIIRDITRRKENERKLKLHAETLEKMTHDLKKFELAVANASDLIIITDSNGVVLDANSALERTTGYAKNEVIGKNVGILWGKQMKTAFRDKLLRTVKYEKKSFIGDLVSNKKSGDKYYSELRVSPILNEKNEVIFFVAIERDITKEKEINRAKTEFVSIASHELRTPLANMSLSVEMLLDDIAGELSADQKNYLRGLQHDIRGMAELTDALLNISRIELGTLVIESEPTNMTEITDAVLKDLAPQIKKKNMEIIKQYENNIPIINIDRNIMRIVLRNLFINSIKYTPRNGRIICGIQKNNNEIIIKISDNGCGIPKDQQLKIFNKLFRARNAIKTRNKGVGLGLYIVKSMIEQCGGRVWFESEENKGAIFYIALPFNAIEKNK